MAPAGPWELAFLFWRRDLFFARKRDFCVCVCVCVFCVFGGGVFALFVLVVISRFWGDVRVFWGCFRAT